MDAASLYKAGQLKPAIEALGMELRRQPSDTWRRTFLFELLCFVGDYDRAGKQLDLLAGSSKDAEAGGMLYRAALHAQQTRESMFANNDLPAPAVSDSPSGLLNGSSFDYLSDEDPRLGACVEVFIAGSYTWVPFRYVESLEIAPPTRLRDLLWAPAILKTTPEFRLQDLGEVLLPCLAPLSWKHEDDAVRLGRATVWQHDTQYGAEVPFGAKVFLVGNYAESALLGIRSLTFQHVGGSARAAS